MSPAKAQTSNSVLRNLPSVDELLRLPAARDIAAAAGERCAAELCRNVIDELRQQVGKSTGKDHRKTI